MALHFVSAGVHAPHSDETLSLKATRGSSHSARRLRSLAFLGSSKVTASPAKLRAENNNACVHRSIRLLEIAISVYVLVAIIKKRLKIDASFHTILQILSLIIFE